MTLWPRIEAFSVGPPKRKRRAPLLAAFALLVSTGLHAAALAFFLDRLSRPGVEAQTDAVSVQIVLETPPAPAVAALGGEPSKTLSEPEEIAETAAETGPTEAKSEDAAVEPKLTALAEPTVTEPDQPIPDLAEQDNVATAVSKPTVPEQSASESASPAKLADAPPLARPQPPLEQLAAIVPRDPVAELTPLLPESESVVAIQEPPSEESRAEIAFAQAAPDIDAPVPSPRPIYRVSKAKPAKPIAEKAASQPAKPARKADKAAPAEKAQASGKPARREKAPRTSANSAGSASAKGGASAGAEAKYGQKLLSHVQRHKRYPEAAARQKITGATKVAITIDRSGALAGARVASGSGHAILDEEAVAVARRAAPYPRPPEGVGGGTISFSVTLRFKR